MSMFQILLLVMLLLGTAAGWYIFRRLRPMRPTSTPLVIENIQKGGVLTLSDIDDEVEDLDMIVLGRHLYEEEGYQWFELEGEVGPEKKLWLCVERDDELEVSVTLRKIDLETLGLTPEDLTRFKKKESGRFSFQGAEYTFEEYGKATFYPHEDRANGKPFSYWEFVCEAQQRGITIERWQRGGVECHLSQMLKPGQYQVHTIQG
ncbi:MAG: DUF4178 domain-containing protein [Magnetococcales bacterium]|nr:DUF4178 domain-containing protein [Magnetococcales bacterium]